MALRKLPVLRVGMAAVCVAAFGAASLPPLVRPAFAQATVHIPEAGISFIPPAGYQRAKVASGTVFRYSGAAAKRISSGFNLAKNPALPGEKINKETADRMVGVLKKLQPSYKKVATGTLTVAGEPAAFVSGTLSPYTGKIMEVKQVFLTHKGQVYNFTFSAHPSVFNKQVVAFDTMLTTVKWL